MGIGIGIIIGVIAMFSYKSTLQMSDAEIEQKARALGMHTDDDCKAYETLKGDESKK